MTRVQRRRNTKTKAMRHGKNGRAIKSRYARTWKKDGRFMSVLGAGS